MKVPDKIYLQTCGECPGLECDTCRFEELAEVSWCVDRIYETDKEYIRKDVLLEWAESYKNAVIEQSKSFNGFAARASKAVLEDLIDKLNSM